jgi:hypothetical protein
MGTVMQLEGNVEKEGLLPQQPLLIFRESNSLNQRLESLVRGRATGMET